MKKIIYIFVLTLLLVSCGKGSGVETAESESSSQDKTTSSTSVAKTRSTTSESQLEETSKAEVETTTETNVDASEYITFFEASDEERTKIVKAIQEASKNAWFSSDFLFVNETYIDYGNLGGKKAIIIAKFKYDELVLFKVDLDKEVSKAISMYEPIGMDSNIVFFPVKFSGFSYPIFYCYKPAKDENAWNIVSFYDFTEDKFENIFEQMCEAYRGDFFLNDKDDDGVYDSLINRAKSQETLDVELSINYDFVDGKVKIGNIDTELEEYPNEPLDVVKKYINLSYLKEKLSKNGGAMPNVEKALTDMSNAPLKNIGSWNKDLVIGTVYEYTPKINFVESEPYTSEAGNKAVKIDSFVDGLLYEKSVGFGVGKTVSYILEEIDGKWMISRNEVMDADWRGRDEMYVPRFFDYSDRVDEYILTVYDGKKSKYSCDVDTKVIYKNDSSITLSMEIIRNPELENILDDVSLYSYFIEKDGILYYMDEAGYVEYDNFGELEGNSICFISKPLNPEPSKPKLSNIDGLERCSVKKEDNIYTIKIFFNEGKYKTFKFIEGGVLHTYEEGNNDGRRFELVYKGKK